MRFCRCSFSFRCLSSVASFSFSAALRFGAFVRSSRLFFFLFRSGGFFFIFYFWSVHLVLFCSASRRFGRQSGKGELDEQSKDMEGSRRRSGERREGSIGRKEREKWR